MINTISSITKENFILSPGVDARVTIHSTGRIPASEALSVFESILEVNNLALVKSGRFYKIVPGAVAKQKPIEVKKGRESEGVSDVDRVITQIIPVEYVPVGELTPVIQPLISQFGSIIPNMRNNLLIINDVSSNIKRILLVLKEVDADSFNNSRMFFYQPKYSDVKTISDELTDIINALNLTREGNISLVPVERINSLIIFSSSASLLETAKQWLQNTNSLVILAPPGMYREITDTIKKLDIYPQEVLIEVLIAEVTLNRNEQFGIQWSGLRGVQSGNDNFTGIGQGLSGQSGIPALPFKTDSLDPSSLTASSGLGANANGLALFLFKPDKFLALLHALASSGKVDVLSSPRLLVRNQEEASIDVGEEIPTASSSTTAATATTSNSTLTQNIEYKTVGIKLKIKPSINTERTVVLDIEQEVSNAGKNQIVGGLEYPSFSTRKTKTSVVVPDNEGVIIGGIIKEKKNKDYQGIPILSAIPLLGHLFRYTVNSKDKTELIIMLTPHVISNQTEADKLTEEFLGKLKDVKDYLKKSNIQINAPAGEEEKK
ncbi:MAG: hypothetical protein HY758_05585 [Nitrospirae bacterium]|nr:hypothetical protein [Nitrospirota bacterium]